MFIIIIVFWLGCDRPPGLLFFMLALLLSILMILFLPSLSVSLSYFILAVPMRECLGKHSCMSSPCPRSIMNGTFLFLRGKIVCLGQSLVYQNQIKLNILWSDATRNVRLFVSKHIWKKTVNYFNQWGWLLIH